MNGTERLHGTRGVEFWRGAWPFILTSVVVIVVAALALATFRDYGIGWDGRVQDVYGQKLLAYYVSGLRDQSAFTFSDLRFYGGFFDLLAAVINHVSPLGEFETRHLLGAVVFLFGLVGAWRLTRLLAGERAAALAVLFLATTPALYGHAFINPKDSPFAWLLVWVTYFACRILSREHKSSVLTYLGFAVSLGLALGTKVFAVAYLGYLVAILIGVAMATHLWGKRHDTTTDIRPTLKPLIGAALVAGLIMAVFWPWAVQSPDNFLRSIATFLRFPHQVPVLWEGETLSSTHPPFNYLLVMLALKLPEHVLLGFRLAGVFAVRECARMGRATISSIRAQQMLFVAMSAAVPILAFIVLRPTVYNGMRQYLFIVPPLVIMAAIAVDHALTIAARFKTEAAVAFGMLLALATTREVLLMYSLHPYEYVAFNALAGNLVQAGREFELDYWGTSLAEAGRDIPKVLAAAAVSATASTHAPKIFICGDKLSAAYFMPRSITITTNVNDADYIMEPDSTVCDQIPHRVARTVLEIKRDGAVLGRILDIRIRAATNSGTKDQQQRLQRAG